MPDAPTAADAAALEFLDERHPIYVSHEEAWKRDERRLHGGDDVLGELTQWKGEGTSDLDARKREAEYVPFPAMYADTLIGHLAQVRPAPGKGFSFGTLGEVRPREEVAGQPQLAEIVYYNVDGIGADGSEWPAWSDGVHQRACATGHRWTLVEMPSMADVRGTPVVRSADGAVQEDTDAVPTNADVAKGFRPYGVEFSPLQVPMWEIDKGRLDYAIIRLPVRSRPADGSRGKLELGYYLLVRAGFDGLGGVYRGGGYWLYTAEKELVRNGRWTKTGGQIPLFALFGDDAKGTTERPAMSRSLTMELGQLAIGLMKRISERDYNASQAAKAITYILGANPTVDPTTRKPEDFNLTVNMHEMGALVIPVFAWVTPAGDVVQPTLWNSAAAAVPADVFDAVVNGKFKEAREIMIRQLTSPDSSAASREAAFEQDRSPLLARMAANRQRWEQTFIYFCELRAGATQPKGYSVYPREFKLAPVVDNIDRMLALLRRSRLSSPTLEQRLVLAAADELGFGGDAKDRKQIESELTESAAESARMRARAEEALGEIQPPPADEDDDEPLDDVA